jgi:putative iron-dependent peroxidase
VRHNIPFGEIGKGEFGTYYIGYSRSPAVTEHMLRNMFIGDPPGNTDRILDFSTAVTGGLFFSPTVDFLNDPPPLPGFVASSSDVSSDTRGGSLAIGSLNGTRRWTTYIAIWLRSRTSPGQQSNWKQRGRSSGTLRERGWST